MERDRASDLHARLMLAVERCENVQRQSRDLVAHHDALHAALSATLNTIHRDRAARRADVPPPSGK